MIATPQEELVLNQDEVHIWSLSLAVPPRRIECLRQVLNGHESQRASQFRFPEHRNQFITCRGLLRHILSLYLHQDPSQLQFSSNGFGKPHLRIGCKGNADLRFNYSHSEGLAVFAFAVGMEVGVDVERIKPHIAEDTIPEHFFCKAEVAALRALPLELQGDEFFRYWTRKEAYVKARGEGFRIPLNSFEVSTDRIVSDRDNSEWSLQSFVPAAGYVAALVTEGQGLNTRFIQPSQQFFTQQEGVPCCTC